MAVSGRAFPRACCWSAHRAPARHCWPRLLPGGRIDQARIDQAIRDIVMGVFERAYRILDINRAVLERCARELLARETLDESDIRQLTQGLVRN